MPPTVLMQIVIDKSTQMIGLTWPIFLCTSKTFRHGRPANVKCWSHSAVNKTVDGGALLTANATVDHRWCYALTVHICAKLANKQYWLLQWYESYDDAFFTENPRGARARCTLCTCLREPMVAAGARCNIVAPDHPRIQTV